METSFKEGSQGAENKTAVFTVTETGDDAGGRDRGETEGRYEQYVQPCLAEMLGTALFVFVGCASVMGNAGPQAVQPALAHGLALGVLITVLGPISGGHFNPAVSLSVYLCGGMKLVLLPPYVLAQMAGGMIGAGLTKAMYPPALYSDAHGGAFLPRNLGEATLGETIMTLILTMVVCMGAVNKKTQTPWAAICIGLAVTANIFAGAVVSGACMNPARAFGPAVVAGLWSNHWVYWVGPTCGALLCVSFIRLLLGDGKTRVVLK